jgi:hypothetical protein
VILRLPSRFQVFAASLLVSIVFARPAVAQRDVAAEAEALFRVGKRLLETKDFAHACPELAESYRLDPATGALLALAICHEEEGRTATAWAEYGDVAARSKTEGRSDREQAAREKIAALGDRLSTLTISVSPDVAAIQGLHVKRDGVEVGPAIWGVPIPVDPGAHVVDALAFSRKPWRVTVVVAAQSEKRIVEIPKLMAMIQDDELADDFEHQVATPKRPARTSATSRLPSVEVVTTRTVATTTNTSEASESILPTVGIATIVAGGLALTIGGYYVSRALSKKSEYDSDLACAYDCPSLDAANSAGNDATGFIVAGTLMVGAGVALYTLAPRLQTHSVSFQVAPAKGADNWQLTAVGRF